MGWVAIHIWLIKQENWGKDKKSTMEEEMEAIQKIMASATIRSMVWMGEKARMGQNSRNEKAQHSNESRFLERANSFYPDSLVYG